MTKKYHIRLKLAAALVVAMAATAMTSCDTKACYCYDYTAEGALPNIVYTDASNPCSALNRGTDGSYGSRVCTESDERQPDPGSIATK